jgi:PAS domain S-box-containing protein
MEYLEEAQALFYYATEGIIISDDKGVIRHANPSAEKLFGYGKGEMTGKRIEDLVPKRLAQRHEQLREKYHTNPHPRSMGQGIELFGIKKDGTEVPVEISLSPFSNVKGKFVIAFIVDITLRKKAEETVKRQKEELEMLNKELDKKVKDRTAVLEEAIEALNHTKEELNKALQKEKELNDLKSRFVSMASHEFRTPLATILSSLSLAKKYSEQGETEKEMKHLDRIRISVNNLTDIISDILSISRMEEGKITLSPERFNLPQFATEVLKELQMVAKEEQIIQYSHSGDSEIVFDRKILRHLLFNLVSNAIKFSPERKPIEIKTENKNSTFTLSVKDNGIGISEEDQKHLFERFFRGQNATNIQGTGLGLNIVAKYVEMLEGTIQCSSVLEKGTTFTIQLPLNNSN